MFSLLNYRDNFTIQFLLIVLIVILSQAIVGGGGLVTSLFFMSWFVLKKQNTYALLFLLIILTFSDSRSQFFKFAQQIKPILILLLAFGSLLIKSKNHIVKWFIPFFIIAFFCVTRNEILGVSFQKTLSLFLLFFSIPIIINHFIKNIEDFTQFKYILVVPIIVIVFGLLTHLVNPSFTTLAGRYRGILGNPNGLGIFIAMYFLLFQAIKQVFPGILSRGETRLIMILFIISVLLSQSRTAMIIFFLFYAFNWVFRFQLVLAFSLCLVLFVLGVLISNYLDLIILGLGLEEYLRLDTLQNGSGRTIAWAFAWEHIKLNPLIGNGFTYTNQLFYKNYEALSRLNHQGNAHNSYLTMWLNTGLFGMLSYFGAIVLLFIKASKQYRSAIPILLCFAFSANMESWLTASLNPFTSVFVITLSILVLNKESSFKFLNQENEQ